MLAGRTNGLHGFETSGAANFPEQDQNRDVWVIDPVARTTWHRALDSASAGLTGEQVAALTTTNNQFVQLHDRLYTAGGYGATAQGGLDTHNVLSAIDLPGIIDWVINDTGHAKDSIRTLEDDLFRVTGGAMYAIDDRLHLVFGQSFRGGYIPNRNGQYTNQVRSFEIVDDGNTLEIANVSVTEPRDVFRRRDLNVFPALQRNQAEELEQGLIVLSGVFTESFGAWTVPVEIDSQGIPSMADPNSPSAFKQGMNNYHSAKVGLFSEQTDSMHEILFGGITLLQYDQTSQQFVQDDALPWTNQITSVIRNADGLYEQHLIGEFPRILDLDQNRLRFGANAEFLVAPGMATYDNGVLRMDELREQTVVGHIFGGIFANAPHIRGNADGVSGASDLMFEVVYIPVPEPGSVTLVMLAALLAVLLRRRRFRPYWSSNRVPRSAR